MREPHSASGALVKGLVAGALATWIMGRVTAVLYEREGQRARQREDDARHGNTAYETAADKIAHATGNSLTHKARSRYGSAIHWALGIGAGAAYSLAREPVAALDAAAGLLFGFGFWLLVDELATPLLGLTPGPRAFPWQTHARGLAGHLTYGVAARASLAAADALA